MTMRRLGFSKRAGALYLVFAIPIAIGGYIATSGSFASTASTDAVQLVFNKQQYKVGEVISFTIINNGDESVYVVNNCPNEPLSVYRQTGGGWERLHLASDKQNCAEQPRRFTVDPGRQVNATYRKWKDMFVQPGRYRVVAELNETGSGPAQEFEIVP